MTLWAQLPISLSFSSMCAALRYTTTHFWGHTYNHPLNLLTALLFSSGLLIIWQSSFAGNFGQPSCVSSSVPYGDSWGNITLIIGDHDGFFFRRAQPFSTVHRFLSFPRVTLNRRFNYLHVGFHIYVTDIFGKTGAACKELSVRSWL